MSTIESYMKRASTKVIHKRLLKCSDYLPISLCMYAWKNITWQIYLPISMYLGSVC